MLIPHYLLLITYCLKMDTEQLLEQFQELYDKGSSLNDQQRNRSALKAMTEAKRFAKTHHLLMPYIHACFSITNYCQALFEPEIGADNAMEIIALVESEEKARKFQHDFDQDFYEYTVHWVSACAYDNLAIHTGTRNGYNSPVVLGAVDDGIHVCRRTGKLECIECFREYAVDTCLASGDFEMGEHYARLCATSTARENADDRRYVGYKDLVRLYLAQGKFQAAREALDAAFPFAATFHDPTEATIELVYLAQRLFWLMGAEAELPPYLAEHGFPDGVPEVPSRDENPALDLVRTVNDAIILACQGHYAEALDLLVDLERFLLGQQALEEWFGVRTQRIAVMLLAGQKVDEPADELRKRASKACQWSAIYALDTMLQGRCVLNPAAIPFPIDRGPFATPGTPPSASLLHLELPLMEKTQADFVPGAGQPPKREDADKSRLEREAEAWYTALDVLWNELAMHENAVSQAAGPIAFPKADELRRLEEDIYARIIALTPETILEPENRKIDEEEFLTLARPLSRMLILRTPERTGQAWNWTTAFLKSLPDRGRPLSAAAHLAFFFRGVILAVEKDAASQGLPTDEELTRMAARAFELEPNRTGVATIAGLIAREFGDVREAQRFFARATQLDRVNEYATVSLAELYDEADRPKDAMAAIDLYTRAGGRHPGMLWKAMEIAFQNEMPQSFLLYYSAYSENQPSFPYLEGQRIWALITTERYADALEVLRAIDFGNSPMPKDRLFLEAFLLAELGDESWLSPFEAALDSDDASNDLTGLFGASFDPCGPLWKHVATLPDTNIRRNRFEQFLFERGLVPDAWFYTDEEENAAADEEDLPLRGYYRCVLLQPLEPQTPAYARWIQIPETDKAYIALWAVLADSEQEAAELAQGMQNRCYPLPSQILACEQLDSYRIRKSQVVTQGRRMPPQEGE